MLRETLRGVPVGPIEGVTRQRVEDILASVWADLSRGPLGGMDGRKIRDRTEGLRWDGTRLAFDIERHGAAVRGSIHAEVQSWEVDVVEGAARLVGTRRRQLRRAAPRWNAEAAAAELAAKVLAGDVDARLRRHSDGSVEVVISAVTPPGAAAQTEAGRRRRFAQAMRTAMEARGWTSGGRGGHRWTPP